MSKCSPIAQDTCTMCLGYSCLTEGSETIHFVNVHYRSSVKFPSPRAFSKYLGMYVIPKSREMTCELTDVPDMQLTVDGLH